MMSGSKKLTVLFVIILFFGALFLFSQYTGKGKMKGVITDEQGNPIPEVKIKLFSAKGQAGFEIISEKDGTWKAFWIRGGEWDLDFLKLGFEPKRISIAIDESGKIWDVPIQLKKLEGLLLTKELMDELEKGNVLFNQQNYDGALELFQKILAENPDAYIINLNIGNCWFEKKEYEKAIGFYKKVLESDQEHVKAMVSIGNAYSNLNEMDKALEWYQKASIEKIDDPVILFNIGINFTNKGDMANAVSYLKRAVELKPDFLDGLFQLGIAYTGMTQYKEAAAVFENYLKYDPDSERAQQIKEIMKSLK